MVLVLNSGLTPEAAALPGGCGPCVSVGDSPWPGHEVLNLDFGVDSPGQAGDQEGPLGGTQHPLHSQEPTPWGGAGSPAQARICRVTWGSGGLKPPTHKGEAEGHQAGPDLMTNGAHYPQGEGMLSRPGSPWWQDRGRAVPTCSGPGSEGLG